MARIPYYDLSQAPESYTRLIAARPPLNLYRMLAHAGKTAEGFLALGSAILRENTLDAKLREIAILRTGILCGAGYEVHQHRRVARRVGLSDDKIDALGKDAARSALDATEPRVLEFTDQVVLHVKPPDAVFEALCARLPHGQVAELVLVIGFYMLVSLFLENFEVDIEPPGAVGEPCCVKAPFSPALGATGAWPGGRAAAIWRRRLIYNRSACWPRVASPIRCRRLRAAIGAQRKAHRAAHTERIGKRCNAAIRFDGQRRPTDDR